MKRSPLLFKLTKIALDSFIRCTNAKIRKHGEKDLPLQPSVFVINHFTRMETFFVPSIINEITGQEVLSVAAHELFGGGFGSFLKMLGAIPTNDSERDRIMISSLLKGEMPCVIFPEGQMVKDKKLIEKGKFMVYNSGIRRAPHTGAAVVSLLSEFYRLKITHFLETGFEEGVKAYSQYFDLDPGNLDEEVLNKETQIVPVNITYFPVRARKNIINSIAEKFLQDLSPRVTEELEVECSMIFDGVDIDVNFGNPIPARNYLVKRRIKKALLNKRLYLDEKELKSEFSIKKETINMTQRYMEAIYSMTTVNHDHVMSYLLARHKSKTIGERDFKNRVYLALHRVRDKTKYAHSSIRMNQDYFLMDPENVKYGNFIEAARGDSLITLKDGIIQKEREKFSKAYNFHSIRKDNIVEVLKNEIEPLKDVVRCLDSTIRTPSFLIRKRIREKFLKQDLDLFEQDYRDYFIDGESKPESTGRPFFLRRKFSRKGVLLIHGYMSAPEEIKELAGHIYSSGCSVYGVRMRGHGTSPEDLQGRKWREWLESVWRGEQVLFNFSKDIAVAGFSTGAGLALMEAARKKDDFKCAISINAPLKLSNIASNLASSIVLWNQFLGRLNIKKGKMEFVSNEPENPRINYFRNPVAGVSQLEKLMDETEKDLEKITIPVLVIQGSRDPVVNPESGQQVFDKIISNNKKLEVIDADNHVIVRGKNCMKTFQVIKPFLDDYL